MKTKEKTSMVKVPQVVFRCSVERPGYYRFHYGHFTPGGTFAENSEQSFWDFLKTVDVPVAFVAAFVESLSDSELENCRFGYFSQVRFVELMRYFVESCDTVQLYPGMLALTFNEKEDEG